MRLEYLESQIALYEATNNYGAVDALRALARRIGAPIDAGNVADRRADMALYRASAADISFRYDSPPKTLQNDISAALAGEHDE